MRSGVALAAALALCVSLKAADAQTVEPLNSNYQTIDEELDFFLSCAALGRATWKTVNPDFAAVLGLDPAHPFFAMRHENLFSRRASRLAFRAAGHDWDELWHDGQKAGALPLWTLIVSMGVQAVETQAAGRYKKAFETAKAGDSDAGDVLVDIVNICAEVGDR